MNFIGISAKTVANKNLVDEVVNEIPKFNDFFKIPFTIMLTVGGQPYRPLTNRKWLLILMNFYYRISFINANLTALGELIYFKNAIGNKDTILEATATAPCALFVVAATIKEFVLWYHKELLCNVLDELRDIFPEKVEDQKTYQLIVYKRKLLKAMKIFIGLCFVTTTIFSMFPIIKSLLKALTGRAEKYNNVLALFIWYPYDPLRNNWTYGLTFFDQAWAAYAAGVGFVGADLMLCATLSQCAMHFDHISRTLNNYMPEGDEKDLPVLKKLICYHSKMLM